MAHVHVRPYIYFLAAFCDMTYFLLKFPLPFCVFEQAKNRVHLLVLES